MSGWAAMSKWSNDYLTRVFGDKDVIVGGYWVGLEVPAQTKADQAKLAEHWGYAAGQGWRCGVVVVVRQGEVRRSRRPHSRLKHWRVDACTSLPLHARTWPRGLPPSRQHAHALLHLRRLRRRQRGRDAPVPLRQAVHGHGASSPLPLPALDSGGPSLGRWACGMTGDWRRTAATWVLRHPGQQLLPRELPVAVSPGCGSLLHTHLRLLPPPSRCTHTHTYTHIDTHAHARRPPLWPPTTTYRSSLARTCSGCWARPAGPTTGACRAGADDGVCGTGRGQISH